MRARIGTRGASSRTSATVSRVAIGSLIATTTSRASATPSRSRTVRRAASPYTTGSPRARASRTRTPFASIAM